MKVLKEYQNSHHYIYDYEKEDSIHCPSCGFKTIWLHQGYGDYYLGPNYICTNCDHSFTYQGSVNDSQISSQLRSGVMNTPTTPKGN